MRRFLLSVSCVLVLGILGPPAAGAATSPPQDRDWCGQVAQTPTWCVKNIDVLCRIDAVRHTWNADGSQAADPATPSGYRETLTQAISINVMDHGNPRPDQPEGAATRAVMFVAGRFGLKSFDITNPTQPKLLDWLGDGVGDPYLEDGNPASARRRRARARSTTCGRTRTWTSLRDQGPHPVDVLPQPGHAVPGHLEPDEPDRGRVLPARHRDLGDLAPHGAPLLGRPRPAGFICSLPGTRP